MKRTIGILLASVFLAISAFGGGKTVHVRSYYRKDGTYVHAIASAQADALNLSISEKLIGEGTFYSPARLETPTINKFRIDL